MIGQALQAGHSVCSDPSLADCVVVNTCAFIRPAVEESIDTILEMARWKSQCRDRRLIVTGCLPQRYGQALADALLEVDTFLGTGAFHQIGDALDTPSATPQRLRLPPVEDAAGVGERLPRLQTTPAHTAYLKIAEGCSDHCTYCIIPKLRGRQRSRPMNVIVSEAEKLAQGGVKELVLVAQNTTAYGQDMKKAGHTLAALLDKLAQIAELAWIRVLYGHPDYITEALMESMASHPNICPYVDIPVQHASEDILKKMGRRPCPTRNLELVDRLRRMIPGVAIRTSCIVGFPGETQEDFETLKTFIQRSKFDHLGVFMYSDDHDLPSNRLPGHIDEAVKLDRFNRLMEQQAAISRQNYKRFVGRTQKVLVDSIIKEDDRAAIGRTVFQAPEIDGVVYLEGNSPKPGTFVSVSITKAHDYDLTGRIE
jgi:ribosomal protein S12 methylthiotransferase